jgi:hypothetical protein
MQGLWVKKIKVCGLHVSLNVPKCPIEDSSRDLTFKRLQEESSKDKKFDGIGSIFEKSSHKKLNLDVVIC